MFDATREKTRLWLLILVGVVATLLGQTHAREIFAPSPHESGVFAKQTQASTGENYDGIQYDALDSLLAANAIDSAAVRFSQSSISRNFSAGGTIDDLAAGLRNGSVNPTSIPPVRLVERGGSMSTLDNRRLWSFQQAEVPIPYRMATPQEAAAEAWKFTTTSGGTSIRVRGQ